MSSCIDPLAYIISFYMELLLKKQLVVVYNGDFIIYAHTNIQNSTLDKTPFQPFKSTYIIGINIKSIICSIVFGLSSIDDFMVSLSERGSKL